MEGEEEDRSSAKRERRASLSPGTERVIMCVGVDIKDIRDEKEEKGRQIKGKNGSINSFYKNSSKSEQLIALGLAEHNNTILTLLL